MNCYLNLLNLTPYIGDNMKTFIVLMISASTLLFASTNAQNATALADNFEFEANQENTRHGPKSRKRSLL